jgi:hypothetical protein
MSAQDPVAEFIGKNNAVIDKLKEQLDTADNQLLTEGDAPADRGPASAGASRALPAVPAPPSRGRR